MKHALCSKLTAAALALALAGGFSLPQAAFAESTVLCESAAAQSFGAEKVSISALSFSKIPAQVYTGKKLKPKITVKNGSKTLTCGKDYTVTYQNNKNIGTATVVVKGIGGYTGSKKLSFKIKPDTPIVKAESADGICTISWNKVRGAGGYQVYYSKNGGKFKKLTSTSKTSYNTLKTNDGTYRFKVRAYKKVSGKTIYGSFSDPVIPDRTSENLLGNSGEVLTILSHNTYYYSYFATQFAAEKGIKVNVVEVDYPYDYEIYCDYVYSYNDCDVMIVPSDVVGKLINSENITAPLSAVGLDKEDFTQAYEYELAKGTAQDGKLYAAGFISAPGGFVYRTDLAKQYLGVTDPSQMQELVKDWDSFVETAAKLYEKSGGKTALLSAINGGVVQAYFDSYNESWVKNGKLNTAKAEDYLDFAQTLIQNNYVTDEYAWSDYWINSISSGAALGEFLPSWGLSDDEYYLLSQFSGDGGFEFALCEGPSPYSWGGDYICVSQKCDNADLAREFIEFCCMNEKFLSEYVSVTGDFVNNKAVMANADNSIALLGGQNSFKTLSDSFEKIDTRATETMYDEEIESCFMSALYIYAFLDIDKQTALESFKQSVAEVVPNLGV